MNILKDDECTFSRKMLEAKRENLVVSNGNRHNATCSLTEEEGKEKLFQTGTIGAENPLALQKTMWWILSRFLADGSNSRWPRNAFLAE